MAAVVRKKVQWNCARHFNWDKWTDGRTWRVTKDKDFKTSVEVMRNRIYSKANRLGLKVRTKKEDSKNIVFQFYKG